MILPYYIDSSAERQEKLIYSRKLAYDSLPAGFFIWKKHAVFLHFFRCKTTDEKIE